MTTKKQEVRKVPNLRFPGFEGEWESNEIGQLMKIGSGKDYKHLSEGDIPVFGTGGLMTSVNDYLMDGESVCIGRKGTINKPFYYSGKFWTVDTLFFTHSFKNIIPKFAFYTFEKINWLKYNEASGVPSLSKSTIEQIETRIPSISEQKIIANFLSLIDERIQCQIKIIQKLESLILQFIEKTLNQQIRFENQDHFPSWTTHKLGDIGETYNGLTNKTKEDFGIGKPYIQYKQIFDQSKIDISRCGLVDVVSSENQNRVRKGDVFFTTSSETPEEIGMASVLLDDIEEMYLNSFCFGYRLNSTDILSPYFARFLFRSKNFRTEIIKLAQGSTRYNMSKIEMMKIEVHLPCLTEQILIADFLTSIEDKIVTEKQILDQYKNQKAYLLQNMFI